MKTDLRLLAASFFLFFGCVLFGAQPPSERFFSDMVETYGVPEGVGELTGPSAKRERHYRFQYDSKGRVVRVESREPDGQITFDFFHVRVLTFEYDGDGSLLHRVWRSPEGTVDLVWRYEGPDRIFFEEAFPGELPPLDFMPFRDGLFQDISKCITDLTACGNLAGLSLARDDRGRVVRVDFLRTDGAKGFDSQETAGHRYERDELGRFTKAVLLNGKGEPHTDSFGVSEYRIRYEGDHLAEIGCYGVDGKPVNNNRGFAFLRQEIPGPGLYKTAFFGVHGEPVLDKQDGYSFCITRTRSDGRTDTVSFYGPDGLPCAAGLRGASRLDVCYPDRYTEEIRLTSPDGLQPASGFQRIRVSRNRFGRVIRREFFPDESDEPGEIWIDTLSEKGLLKEREIRKPDGIVGRIREVRQANGALSARITTDGEGKIVREEHFGYDRLGNCLKYWITGSGGFRWELDEDGRQAKRYLLGKEGQDTGMVLSMTYDGSGRCRTETVLSVSPDSSSGIRKTVHTWNARGDLVREDFFRADGTPPEKGHASILREYDERGNEILVRGVSAKGSPALLPGKSCAEIRRTFDSRDNMIAVMWLDRELLPVFQSGFLPVFEELSAAIVRMRYDLDGDLIYAELFPEDETGFPNFGGAAEIRFERKDLHRGGWEVLLSFYDLSGEPFHAFGGPSTALRFRSMDGVEYFTFLNENQEKVLEPGLGYAEKVTDETETTRYYDEKGKQVTPVSTEEGEEQKTETDGSDADGR